MNELVIELGYGYYIGYPMNPSMQHTKYYINLVHIYDTWIGNAHD